MKIVTLTKKEFLKRAYEANPQLDEEYDKLAKEINEQTNKSLHLNH